MNLLIYQDVLITQMTSNFNNLNLRTTVFVKNLPNKMDESTLREIFQNVIK